MHCWGVWSWEDPLLSSSSDCAFVNSKTSQQQSILRKTLQRKHSQTRSAISPPQHNLISDGLLGRIEEGKGEAYATKIDVRCSDRNRIISTKRILIATRGSATAEMAIRYSCFGQWLSRVWMAFMDESQQSGNYQKIAALLPLVLMELLGPLSQQARQLERRVVDLEATVLRNHLGI